MAHSETENALSFVIYISSSLLGLLMASLFTYLAPYLSRSLYAIIAVTVAYGAWFEPNWPLIGLCTRQYTLSHLSARFASSLPPAAAGKLFPIERARPGR